MSRETFDLLCVLCGSRLYRPVEFGSVDPHAVQNDCELSPERKFGLAQPVSLGAWLPTPSALTIFGTRVSSRPAASTKYMRSIASPHFKIQPVQPTAPKEWRRVVNPASGSNASRSLKARRIVDRRFEMECSDRAETKHGHESADLNITTRELVTVGVEFFDLLLNGPFRTSRVA